MRAFSRAIVGAAFSGALAAGSATIGAAPASAHAVATRCDWRGCSHIVCNYTGDRCHRFFGAIRRYYDRERYGRLYRESGYAPYYDRARFDHEGRYRFGEDFERWRYDCDRDADRCYVRRSYAWDRGPYFDD